jgi:homoserine O-succinyltransferase
MALLVKPNIADVSSDTKTSSTAGWCGEIVVALVNLMPPSASHAITRQYEHLLALASGRFGVRLRVFTLGGGSASESISSLWNASFDALIVTGAEPRATVITEEPCWPMLAKIADWAGDHTMSVIWSCLAAHAAVFHLDRIERQRLREKLSGIFECGTISGHGIFAFTPQSWLVPHSRYNTVDEAALIEHGYTVLARGQRIGADIFVKCRNDSLFVFLQGHPEYAVDTLLREYSRDIGRFLSGGRQSYPKMPEGYFDPETVSALAAFQEQTMREPHLARQSEVGRCMVRPPIDCWREAATGLYAGWLSYVAARKQAINSL